ncbi:MAG TPA: carboxypeptidase regulatory-like domain-containing protein, partial [Chitinophagaceae bacterium]|nr:carboxypeptidase regulatory-like domain-containing protein [Chitinophagaceae bacterium]
EMMFSCPADALAYETSRQTPKRDFGEKLQAGDPGPQAKKPFVVPHILEKTGIISGTLTWASSNNGGIVSNAVIGQSPRSGSTTLNSQTSSTRTTNQSSFGTLVRLSAREAGSGLATGKRSREAGSGLATGRRQYEPVFMEGQGDVCNPCLVTAKMSAVNSNPLYKDNGMSGTNPLYNNNNRTVGDIDCDGVAGADVYLINENDDIVAKTKTERCGDFFFANVPEGNYVVRVSGVYRSKKEYDVSAGSPADLTGAISQADEWMQLSISSGTDENGMSQKAGISTSRSNIRTKSISIIEADLDGDGEFESLKVTGTFSDGSSRDITNNAKTTGASGGQELVLDKTALSTRRRVEVLKSNKQGDPGSKTITGIRILNTGTSSRATAVFSDGTTRDVTDMVAASSSGSVRQYNIIVADMDGDGEVEAVVKTKTKSNQSNDRVAAGDTDGDGIWSPRSNVKMIRVATGDVNGDGKADIAAGNALVREPLRSHFETGDIPTEQQRTASVGGMMPGGAVISAAMSSGDPIHGVDVKLGMKSKGTIVATQTNENGEFEWTNLAAGDYTVSFDMNYFLHDETFVSVGGESSNTTASESNINDMTERKGDVRVTAGQNGQSLKIQNNNTVRSNRSELKSILIEADLDGDGDYESDITSRISDEITMDNDGNTESQPQQKAGVSTSRSNIRSRSGLMDKGEGLYVGYGKANLNNKDVPVKILYKARHEMQMSAIRNLK